MTRLTAFTSTRAGPDLWPHMAQPGELLVHTADDGSPWALCYQCPCGCGSPVMVPSQHAVHDGWATWELTDHGDGTYSASPSVRMSDPKGCQSHYFIRHSRVEWC